MAKKSKDGLRDIARARPEEIVTREIRGYRVESHNINAIQRQSVKDEGGDISLLQISFNLMCSFAEWIQKREGEGEGRGQCFHETMISVGSGLGGRGRPGNIIHPSSICLN